MVGRESVENIKVMYDHTIVYMYIDELARKESCKNSFC